MLDISRFNNSDWYICKAVSEHIFLIKVHVFKLSQFSRKNMFYFMEVLCFLHHFEQNAIPFGLLYESKTKICMLY